MDCSKLGTEDGTLRLSFEGGYLPYIGWNILLGLSFITIIGWAWVAKFMMQWICRNVRGTAEFDFTATGLSILWRTLVAVLLTILVCAMDDFPGVGGKASPGLTSP